MTYADLIAQVEQWRQLTHSLGKFAALHGMTAESMDVDAVAIDVADALQLAADRHDALEFYADPATYYAISFLPDPPCGNFVEDFEEIDGHQRPGKRARASLDYKDGS